MGTHSTKVVTPSRRLPDNLRIRLTLCLASGSEISDNGLVHPTPVLAGTERDTSNNIYLGFRVKPKRVALGTVLDIDNSLARTLGSTATTVLHSRSRPVVGAMN